MRKNSVRVLFLVLFALGFVAVEQSTRASDNEGKGDDPSLFQFSVTPTEDSSPSPEENWPIVDQRTREYSDPKTGARHVVTTVIREKAASPDEMVVGECQELVGASGNKATPDAAPLGTCVYEGQVSRSDVDTIFYSGQKLRHTVVSIAGKYFGNSSTYFKLTKAKNSWWRSSTAWTVQNANHQWGCRGVCTECDGSAYTGYISGGVGTPSWYDDHYTWVYVSTPGTAFPALMAEGNQDGSVRPFAHAWSDGYYNGIHRGTMDVGIDWIQ